MLTIPLDLEFDLLLAFLPLVLDVERCSSWNIYSLTGNLNLKTLAILNGISQPAKLLNEFFLRVTFLDISITRCGHTLLLVLNDGTGVQKQSKAALLER